MPKTEPAGVTNLSPEREAALIHQARNGDRDAMGNLLAAHYGLLRAAAGKASRSSSLSVDDLFQEAVLAFMEAVNVHEGRNGARLATTARARIFKAMTDASLADAPVQVPQSTYWKVREAVDRSINLEEAVAHAARTYGMAEETFLAAVQVLRVESLDSPALAAVPGLLVEGLEDAEGLESIDPTAHLVMDNEDRRQAAGYLGALEGEERAVMAHAMGFVTGAPMTDLEVAEALGMSRATVNRRRLAATARLQAMVAGA